MNRHLSVRVDIDQKTAWEQTARAEGVRLSDLVRIVLDREARRRGFLPAQNNHKEMQHA